MNVEDGIEMIAQIYEKQREDRSFILYTTQYPKMTEENFIPFEKYYKPQKKKEAVKERSSEEILKEVKEMMNSHSVGGES